MEVGVGPVDDPPAVALAEAGGETGAAVVTGEVRIFHADEVKFAGWGEGGEFTFGRADAASAKTSAAKTSAAETALGNSGAAEEEGNRDGYGEKAGTGAGHEPIMRHSAGRRKGEREGSRAIEPCAMARRWSTSSAPS